MKYVKKLLMFLLVLYVGTITEYKTLRYFKRGY